MQGQCSANVIDRSVLRNMIRFTTANVLKKAAKQVRGGGLLGTECTEHAASKPHPAMSTESEL